MRRKTVAAVMKTQYNDFQGIRPLGQLSTCLSVIYLSKQAVLRYSLSPVRNIKIKKKYTGRVKKVRLVFFLILIEAFVGKPEIQGVQFVKVNSYNCHFNNLSLYCCGFHASLPSMWHVHTLISESHQPYVTMETELTGLYHTTSNWNIPHQNIPNFTKLYPIS